jgi:hypothetical protein
MSLPVCEEKHRGHILGQSLKEDDTTWHFYVVSRNITYLCNRTENVMGDQMIHFIAEEEGFVNTWNSTAKMIHCQP